MWIRSRSTKHFVDTKRRKSRAYIKSLQLIGRITSQINGSTRAAEPRVFCLKEKRCRDTDECLWEIAESLRNDLVVLFCVVLSRLDDVEDESIHIVNHRLRAFLIGHTGLLKMHEECGQYEIAVMLRYIVQQLLRFVLCQLICQISEFDQLRKCHERND